MEKTHKKPIKVANHLQTMVGQPFYGKKPSQKAILEELLSGMAEFSGTTWAPVNEVVDGKATSYKLMLNQCPGACGHVWTITIKNDTVARWLVNEINQRHGKE